MLNFVGAKRPCPQRPSPSAFPPAGASWEQEGASFGSRQVRFMVKKRPCPSAFPPAATMPEGAFYGQEGASWEQEGASFGSRQVRFMVKKGIAPAPHVTKLIAHCQVWFSEIQAQS